MKKYNCPPCGAEVAFQSSLSVYAVCRYCSSMIVRRDVDVESIGTMAALPDDMSPLQIGTEGSYSGLRFRLVGRIKSAWDGGYWNEWFMLLEDGREAWLAEAQGFYAVGFLLETMQAKKAATESELQLGLKPKLGLYHTIKNRKYRVVDIKKVQCVGSEGELPFIAPRGRKATCVDFLGDDGEFACMEIEGDERRLYVGSYVEWSELRCRNLRPLEGW